MITLSKSDSNVLSEYTHSDSQTSVSQQPVPLHHTILILSVSAGNGHVRAAQAIKAHAEKCHAAIKVKHIDVMQSMPATFRKIYTDWYLNLASRFPEVWGWLYRKTDRDRSDNWLDSARRLLERQCARSLLSEIKRFAPDAIICTHFLPAELLATAKKRGDITCDIWVQVTDFDLHHMWVHQGLSGYFVANEELAYRLRCHGIPEDRILVSGIPVMPGFRSAPDRRVSAHRFGLDTNRFTILMMGGGAGVGDMPSIAKQILALHQNCQLIVLAGKNLELYQELQSLSAFYPERLYPLGFTQEVDALMACSDLAITKPGGLSVSECLVMGLPMVLVNPIPGQEERNAAILLQEGVAIRADDVASLVYRIQNLLADTEKFTLMKTRAKALAKPEAAKVVLNHVIKHLTYQPVSKEI